MLWKHFSRHGICSCGLRFWQQFWSCRLTKRKSVASSRSSSPAWHHVPFKSTPQIASLRTWKTQGGASTADGAPTLKSMTRTPKNWEKTILCRTVLKCTQPKIISRNEKHTSANSVKFTFIASFFLSQGSYALDAWLASDPARVTIWAGVAGSTQPYTCHHLS